jgi:hypothetical protein
MKPEFNCEKSWITKAGLPAFVLYRESMICKKYENIDLGNYRCGYVSVPENHVFYGKDYSFLDSDIDVHGGLTFSDFLSLEGKKDNYCFGYDTHHSFDYQIVRSLEYCVEECEKLADQLQNSAFSLLCQAKEIYKGKLPEILHNKMLAFGLNNSPRTDKHVKEYIKLINN